MIKECFGEKCKGCPDFSVVRSISRLDAGEMKRSRGYEMATDSTDCFRHRLPAR